MMPQMEKWAGFRAGVRDRLVEREREIGLDDLNQQRLWMESRPDLPERLCDKDFGSFRLCGQVSDPKTFLQPNQAPRGQKL
jgi:hypothetical protein